VEAVSAPVEARSATTLRHFRAKRARKFFRSVKQMFPVLSPEPEMIKNSIDPLGASSPGLSRVLDHLGIHIIRTRQGRKVTRNSAKGARRVAIGRGQSGG
jgi:hypothetical protein